MAPRTFYYVGNNTTSNTATNTTTALRDEWMTDLALDSSVVEIPKGTFSGLRKLAQVTTTTTTLCAKDSGCSDTITGNVVKNNERGQLKVIGAEAFWDCPHLKHVSFPHGLERIEAWAFGNCPKLHPPKLPDNTLIYVGPFAFCGCNFRHLRIPMSITRLSNRMLECCTKLYSIEVPPTLIMSRNDTAFYGCERLRNLVFPNLIEEATEDDGLPSLLPWCHGCDDLIQVVPDPNELTTALVHRFDGLPLHRLCYYQSYYDKDDTGQDLITNLKKEWDRASLLTSKQSSDLSSVVTGGPSPPRHSTCQDFLGMTPLHILALSTSIQLDSMKAMIELDPIQLVTEDFWGFLPIYYACESCHDNSTSSDDSIGIMMIRLLLQHHVTKFPGTKLDWTKLVTATGHYKLAKLLLSEASFILDNVPTRLV